MKKFFLLLMLMFPLIKICAENFEEKIENFLLDKICLNTYQTLDETDSLKLQTLIGERKAYNEIYFFIKNLN